MPRPRKGSDQDLEKALTRTVCQHIYLSSGLAFAELEDLFALGGMDEFGRRTGRTFSRYCESDPSKSRAASRETLARVVKKAAQNGWITDQVIQQWGIQKTLALDIDYKDIESFFAQRRAERDSAAAKLRELREACNKTSSLLSTLRHVIPAQLAAGPHDDKIAALHDFNHSTGVDNPAHEFHHVRAPGSLNEALDWLQVHLDRTVLMMRGGWLDPIAEVNQRMLVDTPKPASKPLQIKKLDGDTADIDRLLNEVEKWCKSGAPVTKTEVM